MATAESEADGNKPHEWKAFPLSAYQQVIAEMVHFSFKTVNSNCAAGGVRLDVARGLRLPYLAVQTLLASGSMVKPDYQKNTGSTATIAKQIWMAVDGAAGVPEEERRHIEAEYLRALGQGLEAGTGSISPRLRQLLIPKSEAEGGYVALTPLSAAGTAVLIGAFLKTHRERRRTDPEYQAGTRALPTATLGIGGSKPQNVGSTSHIRALQSVVVVPAPRESAQLRAALALHHRGPELRLSPRLVRLYAEWRARLRRANDGGMPTSLDVRTLEKQHVQEIALAALRVARRECGLLDQFREQLPVGPIIADETSRFAASVSPLLKGIVERHWRAADWPREMAREIAGKIVGHRLPGGMVMNLNDGDLAYLAGWIEEALWTF
jgi:hypothetical protein